jgi:hypothetical protein
MLFAFDIDCGELVAGHRFIARGLADGGTIESDGQSAPVFSLEYELIPGVPPLTDPSRMFQYLVHVDTRLIFLFLGTRPMAVPSHRSKTAPVRMGPWAIGRFLMVLVPSAFT